MNTGLFPNEILAIETNEAQIEVACKDVIEELQANVERLRGYCSRNAPSWHMRPLGDASYAQKVLDELYLATSVIRGDNSTKGVFSIDYFLEKALSELCLWMAWRKVQLAQDESEGPDRQKPTDALNPEPEPKQPEIAIEPEPQVKKRRTLLRRTKRPSPPKGKPEIETPSPNK